MPPTFASAPALQLLDVTRSYRAGTRGCSARVEALRRVSLTVEAGEVVAVTGGPAAGKSTLLLCAAGLLRPDGGRVFWNGLAARLGTAGTPVFLPERTAVYGFLTVREALLHHATRQEMTVREGERRLEEALERTALDDHATERVGLLPPPLLRRLGVAQALLARPTILLLDEPFEGLDPAARFDASRVLRRLAAEGMALVLTARERGGLAMVAGREVVLRAGEVAGEIGGGRGMRAPARMAPRASLQAVVAEPAPPAGRPPS